MEAVREELKRRYLDTTREAIADVARQLDELRRIEAALVEGSLDLLDPPAPDSPPRIAAPAAEQEPGPDEPDSTGDADDLPEPERPPPDEAPPTRPYPPHRRTRRELNDLVLEYLRGHGGEALQVEIARACGINRGTIRGVREGLRQAGKITARDLKPGFSRAGVIWTLAEVDGPAAPLPGVPDVDGDDDEGDDKLASGGVADLDLERAARREAGEDDEDDDDGDGSGYAIQRATHLALADCSDDAEARVVVALKAGTRPLGDLIRLDGAGPAMRALTARKVIDRHGGRYAIHGRYRKQATAGDGPGPRL